MHNNVSRAPGSRLHYKRDFFLKFSPKIDCFGDPRKGTPDLFPRHSQNHLLPGPPPGQEAGVWTTDKPSNQNPYVRWRHVAILTRQNIAISPLAICMVVMKETKPTKNFTGHKNKKANNKFFHPFS